MGDNGKCLFAAIHAIPSTVIRLLEFLNIFLSVNNWSFVPLHFLGHPFCTSAINVSLCRWSCSSSVSIPLNIFDIRDKHVIRLKFVTSFSFSLTFKITTDLLIVSQSVISLSLSIIVTS